MDARDVLIRPVISEKATDLLQDGKYTFMVPIKANKVRANQGDVVN